VVARHGPWRAPVTSAAAPVRAGLPLPDKHEALLAEMLFAQMLRLPAPALKPLAYSALMARPGAGRGLCLGRQSLPAHACLASTLAKGLNAEAVSALGYLHCEEVCQQQAARLFVVLPVSYQIEARQIAWWSWLTACRPTSAGP
jgi:hypothetical protein